METSASLRTRREDLKLRLDNSDRLRDGGLKLRPRAGARRAGDGDGHTSADASAEAAERDDERDLNRDSPTTDLQLQDVEQDVAGSLQVEYDANGRRRVR